MHAHQGDRDNRMQANVPDENISKGGKRTFAVYCEKMISLIEGENLNIN
jgi:hypothetical protein